MAIPETCEICGEREAELCHGEIGFVCQACAEGLSRRAIVEIQELVEAVNFWPEEAADVNCQADQ